MKLVRHGPQGSERPGIIDAAGGIPDLSGKCQDFGPAFFAANGIAVLRDMNVETLPKVSAGSRIGPCVAQPGNFIAIGLNYGQHARETNSPIPKDPIIFNKAPSCICGPNDTVLLPKDSRKSDWEVEIAFVMGKRAHYVSEAEALNYVAGYFVCNDVSEREYQLERSGQGSRERWRPRSGLSGLGW
jgi:2-keto-4-pentenoate hydratase/2-oxohepta-3-ene-1,7-dioic acid hydratase in catechol pathway